MQVTRTSMGDLIPGTFTVPQNPILMNAAQKNPAALASLGDLVSAAFTIPENPIMRATSMDRPKVLTPPDTRNALVRSLTASRTGPASSDIGMGDAASTLQSIGGVLDNTYNVGGTDVPYWVFAIGGVALLMYLTGGKSGPSRYQRFRAAH
jgi:hypothetical protein